MAGPGRSGSVLLPTSRPSEITRSWAPGLPSWAERYCRFLRPSLDPKRCRTRPITRIAPSMSASAPRLATAERGVTGARLLNGGGRRGAT